MGGGNRREEKLTEAGKRRGSIEVVAVVVGGATFESGQATTQFTFSLRTHRIRGRKCVTNYGLIAGESTTL